MKLSNPVATQASPKHIIMSRSNWTNTDTNTPRIPPELILEILPHLHDDIATLKSACLAASAFRAPCQALLFYHLSLPRHTSACGYRADNERCRCGVNHEKELKPLIEILAKNTAIAYNVRSLTIECKVGHRFPGPKPQTSFKEYLNLIRVLELLHVDRILHLAVVNHWAVQWRSTPSNFLFAIVKFCAAPSLVSLRLEYVPTNLARFCRASLKSLSLRHTEGKRNRSMTIEQFVYLCPDEANPVEALHLPWGFRYRDVQEQVREVEDLYISVHGRTDAIHYQPFFNQFALTLKTLAISVAKYLASFDIYLAQNVTSLTIRGNFEDNATPLTEAAYTLQKAVAILSTLSPHNAVKTLTIQLGFPEFDPEMDVRSATGSLEEQQDKVVEQSKDLAQLLCREGNRFGELREVVVEWCFEGFGLKEKIQSVFEPYSIQLNLRDVEYVGYERSGLL